MVRFWGPSLMANLAHCMEYAKVWWFIRCAYHDPFHFDDVGLPCDLNIMSL